MPGINGGELVSMSIVLIGAKGNAPNITGALLGHHSSQAPLEVARGHDLGQNPALQYAPKSPPMALKKLALRHTAAAGRGYPQRDRDVILSFFVPKPSLV